MIRNLSLSLFLTFMLLFILSACSYEPDKEVKNFVKKTKEEKAKSIEKLPEFTKFQPFKYSANNLRSPFEIGDLSKLTKPLKQKKIGPVPDAGRPRELLESYPLDSLKMVGTIERRGTYWALIKDANGIVHRVGIGNHMGENSGKIVKITGKFIELTEWVADGEGEFRERMVQLRLSE